MNGLVAALCKAGIVRVLMHHKLSHWYHTTLQKPPYTIVKVILNVKFQKFPPPLQNRSVSSPHLFKLKSCMQIYFVVSLCVLGVSVIFFSLINYTNYTY